MRTTLDLPETLIEEAMTLTHRKSKTDVIKTALENLIQRERIKEITTFFGKINIDIDLDILRDR